MDAKTHYMIKKILRLTLSPFSLFPVKSNRVLLLNRLSLKYACNPKAVTEYLLEHYSGKFEIIYAVNQPKNYDGLRQRGVKVIKFNSPAYFYYLMTCRVFLTNSGGYSYVPLRMDKQFVINTHHGGGAYKTFGLDMYEDTPTFRADLKLSADQTSLLLSTNKKFSEVASSACLTRPESIWEIGMPRNDILIHPDPVIREAVRRKLNLKEGEKLVLFAPTYRKVDDNYFNDSVAISYGIDSARTCAALERRFGGKWVFAIRYHPCVVNREQFALHGMLDLTDYEDMQDLLLAADVLINDFSSSMWDFMLTGKPCFLFAKDLKHYVETTKVYTPVAEWPFPKAESNEELEFNIWHFDEKKYHEDCKRNYEKLGGCETGKATQLVAEKIYEMCFAE